MIEAVSGALLIDKPAGLTSHDVVARVRRIYRTRAVGHTGTLDPFATGLLVLLLGRATRLARFVEQQPKTYLATARLGARTTTDDLTGALRSDPEDRPLPTLGAVRSGLADLLGEQRQRPPIFSAKRIAGVRSYARARRGEPIEPAEVAVTVHRIEPVAYRPPDLTFRTTVSPGTYVRAMARDLGERLGVGAHLTALRREAIGLLRVERALPLDRLGPETPLLSPAAVLLHLPAVEVDQAGRRDLAHGRAVVHAGDAQGEVALMQGGLLLAVGIARAGRIQPTVVLESAE